jgi:hypothetical protein
MHLRHAVIFRDLVKDAILLDCSGRARTSVTMGKHAATAMPVAADGILTLSADNRQGHDMT